MVKGQLIPFAFLVFLVAGIMIGYVFFNTYYGFQYKEQTLQISIIDAIGNVAQSLKNYLTLALSYSSNQALREHACVGGTVGSAPWICNKANPPPVQQSKECLEKYTVFYFDTYYDMFDSSLPVNITKYTNFTKCVYGIDEEGVFSGNYDEGDFWVNCSGATIIISGVNRNATLIENLNTTDVVTKNRYWYMFRKFYEWAMADVYSPCICSIIGCSCSSGSGSETCNSCSGPAEGCAETAFIDLKGRFDSDISCIKEKMCCQQGVGPSCLPPSGCVAWENPCGAKCNHECAEPSVFKRVCPAVPGIKEEECSVSESSSKGTFLVKDFKLSYLSFGGCTCQTWTEGRVAAGYKYTCQDNKYFVPSDKGPVPLMFSVTAYAFWRKPDACKNTIDCDCRTGEGCCSECI
jgi:hypothetical protein